MYALTATDIIKRSDGAFIPPDPENVDYRAYLAWIAAGNTPTPYTAPVIVPDSATASQVIVWLGRNSNANGNYLTQVLAYIESLPVGHPVRAAWEREPVFKRDAQAFQGIAQLLGLTPQQVNAGLIEANLIEV